MREESLLEQIQDAMSIKDEQKRVLYVKSFGTVFELHTYLPLEEVIEAVNFLLNRALEENDESWQYIFLDLVSVATNYREEVGRNIELNYLVKHLPFFSLNNLITAIEILGYSEDKKYIPVLQMYLSHIQFGVRDGASDAIANINLAIARNDRSN